MTDKYYDALWGSDRYSGRGPNEAKHSLTALNIDLAQARPEDRFFLRNGSVWRGELKPTCKGQADANILITGYALGGEDSHAPVILNTGAKSKAIHFTGDHVTVDGVEVYDAETGVYMAENATGNTFVRGWVENCGWGFVDRGLYSLVEDNIFYRMKMARNEGLDTDAGGNWGSLERHSNEVQQRGARVMNNTVLFAQAPSLKFKRDGGFEIFGGIEDATIEGNTVWHTKGFIEIGGKTELKQTVRNVLIKDNFVMNPSGIALHVNGKADKFYADFEGVVFDGNTIYADDVQGKSPFWFVGDHGDLSTKLTLRNNTITMRSGVFGSDGRTDLNSIVQEGNTYIRTDGGKLGAVLKGDNTFNTAHGKLESLIISVSKPETVPTLQALLRLSTSIIDIGHTVKVLDGRLEFELDRTRTWRLVRRMRPLA